MRTYCYLLIVLICLPLCLSGQSTRSQPEIKYNPVSRQFFVQNLPPPDSAAGAEKAPYWSYFWEFGDGHYSTARNPHYCYSGQGIKNIRLSLVPHYSYSPTRVIRRNMFVGGSCNDAACRRLGACNGPNYNIGSKLVQVGSNADHELVPNNEIQLAIHLRMPRGATAGEGDLFLFYQDQEVIEELGFPPLIARNDPQDQQRNLFALTQTSVRSVLDAGGSNYRLARSLYESRSYGRPLVYRCRIAPGETQRLFISLAASRSLRLHRFDDKKGELVPEIKAVWVPHDYAFNEGLMLDNYPLKMLSVHDPNRIRVRFPNGRATYVRNHPQTFEVEIDFQNRGGSPARQVIAAVDWPENLDPNSIEILGRDPTNSSVCPDCPNGPLTDTTSSCFQLDTSRVASEGKVYFIFHNVMIHGKRETGLGGNEFTKGRVRFSARSNNRQRQQTAFSGGIIFDNEDPIATRERHRNWRHRGLGLRVGYNLGANNDDFDAFSGNFRDWLQVGLYYRRSSLKEGLTPFAGVELNYSGQGLNRDLAYNTFFDNEVSSLALFRERLNVQTLDILATTEFRVGGVFSLVLGAGPSLPLWAKSNLTFSSLQFSEVADFPQYESLYFNPEEIGEQAFEELLFLDGAEIFTSESRFGLFGEDQASTFLNNITQPPTSQFRPGALVSISGELGDLNRLTMGFRYSFRFYPNTYLLEDLNFSSIQAYLRINLTSLGRNRLTQF